ncbi:MAG: hypothetical protein U9N02_07950 [Campylobacterota bacterium]|nr:hypothetical protein [Campylobacterota bacterium]
MSIEEQAKLDLEAQEAKEASEAEEQAKKDAQRGHATDYMAHKSKQSQVEIYLSIALNKDVDLGNGTPAILESLRDVQQQNNRVEAYATYAENQKMGII